MNKTELIREIALKADSSQKDAEKFLNAFIESAEEAFVKGEKIQLVGFGAFEVRERAARQGRNPKTKEVIQIPASKTIAFKAGKQLKDSVNK